ncbi:hypothetical protein ACS0TY_018279 [Phlomoides rotata]
MPHPDVPPPVPPPHPSRRTLGVIIVILRTFKIFDVVKLVDVSFSGSVTSAIWFICRRLTAIFLEGGDEDLLLQRSDSENGVLQWPRALDLQVMGACRGDESLSGSPDVYLSGPIKKYIMDKGGRFHLRWGCREILYDKSSDGGVYVTGLAMSKVPYSSLRGEELSVIPTKINMVDLPLGAAEDRVCSTIDIEKAPTKGVKAFEPGDSWSSGVWVLCARVSEFIPLLNEGRQFYEGMGVLLNKGRPQFRVSVSNVATEVSPSQEQKRAASKENQRPVYPFAAIVGQGEMKLCLLLNVI